jgi:hypothetical protein
MGNDDLTALFDLTVEPAGSGFPSIRPDLKPRQTFTESLILAQDERWRRA